MAVQDNTESVPYIKMLSSLSGKRTILLHTKPITTSERITGCACVEKADDLKYWTGLDISQILTSQDSKLLVAMLQN